MHFQESSELWSTGRSGYSWIHRLDVVGVETRQGVLICVRIFLLVIEIVHGDFFILAQGSSCTDGIRHVIIVRIRIVGVVVDERNERKGTIIVNCDRER